MKTVPVSLIMTVYNEAHSIVALLDSIAAGSVLPSEMVIADGGSSDQTVATISEWAQQHPELSVRVLRSEKRINIAAGRNIAIEAAAHECIAVTDGGTLADKRWLEQLTAPLLHSAPIDVVAGWYVPLVETEFHRRVARAFVPKLENIRPEEFLPSSRSIAFTRAAWKAAGGYPAELRFAGEDTLFDLRLKQLGFRFAFAPEAVVYWRMRDSRRALLKQYYLYGFGDGEGRLFTGTYLFRFAACLMPPLIALTGKGCKDFWLRWQVYLAITFGWLRGRGSQLL